MNRDDIIRMAGAMFDHMTWVERDLEPVFERFAALIAAAEREACAQIADAEASIEGIAQRVAAAIRARGQA